MTHCFGTDPMAENSRTPAVAIPVVCLVAAFALLYGRLLLDLSRIWSTDANYSHGLLILPLVGYFVWTRREALAATERKPAAAGLVLVVVSLAVLLVGTAGVEFFLMRTSALGVAVGSLLFLAGWGWLRVLAFPIALSVLLVPLPPVVFYQIAFPLQLLATKFGVSILQLTRIPVPPGRECDPARADDARSDRGVQRDPFLLSLFALAVLSGYFATPQEPSAHRDCALEHSDRDCGQWPADRRHRDRGSVRRSGRCDRVFPHVFRVDRLHDLVRDAPGRRPCAQAAALDRGDAAGALRMTVTTRCVVLCLLLLGTWGARVRLAAPQQASSAESLSVPGRDGRLARRGFAARSGRRQDGRRR